MDKRKREWCLPDGLEKKMASIIKEPLTLIRAESGFGKTTAARAYLEKIAPEEASVFWYTCLGEPPVRAWEGICGLMGHVDPKIAGYLKKLVPTRDNIGLLAQLLGEMRGEETVICVIDNYQLAGFSVPEGLLHALSMHRCAGLHIVVISQKLPGGDDATAGLHPRVFEINQEDLRFRKADIILWGRRFCGLRLSGEQAERLCEATNGWIAALRLCLSASDGEVRPGGASMEKLMDRVFWDGLSDRQRAFICTLSALPYFSMTQATAVGGGGVLEKELEELVADNFFISFNGDSRKYVMHALLREHLQCKIERIPIEARRGIWKRGAAACAAEGQTTDAALLYAKADCWDELTALPFSGGELLEMIQQFTEVLEQALERCSLIEASRHYDTILRIAVKAIIRGKSELFRASFTLLERFTTLDSLSREDQRRIQGAMEFIRSFLAYNDVERMCGHHRNALRLLEKPDDLYITTEAWTFSSPDIVYMFWRESGSLARTLEQVRDGLPCYHSLTKGHGTGADLAMEAQMYLLAGDDEAAEKLCWAAQYAAGAKKQDSICYCADFTLSLIALLRGDQELFRRSRGAAARRVYSGWESDGQTAFSLSKAFGDVLLGNLDELPEWLRDPGELRRVLPPAVRGFGQIICARYLLKRHPAAFDGVAGEFLREGESAQVLLPRVYILIFLAIRRGEKGEKEQAAAGLAQALRLAAPDSVYLPFAAFYPEICSMLEGMPSDGSAARAALLGRRFERGLRRVKAACRQSALKLTPREGEVAALAQKRMTAREIAEALCISVPTVNSTLQRAYDKLGIHSKKELSEIEL